VQKSRCALTREAANMNQPTENRLSFNTYNVQVWHISHVLQMINTTASAVKHNDFSCFKGVTYTSPLHCVMN